MFDRSAPDRREPSSGSADADCLADGETGAPPTDPFRSTLLLTGDASPAQVEAAMQQSHEANTMLDRCVAGQYLLEADCLLPGRLTSTLMLPFSIK